jgi:hypothetical protein
LGGLGGVFLLPPRCQLRAHLRQFRLLGVAQPARFGEFRFQLSQCRFPALGRRLYRLKLSAQAAQFFFVGGERGTRIREFALGV